MTVSLSYVIYNSMCLLMCVPHLRKIRLWRRSMGAGVRWRHPNPRSHWFRPFYGSSSRSHVCWCVISKILVRAISCQGRNSKIALISKRLRTATLRHGVFGFGGWNYVRVYLFMPEAKIGKLDLTWSRSNSLLANVFLRNSLTGHKQLRSECQSVFWRLI